MTSQREERDRAIEQVELNSAHWRAIARIAVQNVAVWQGDLTSDDVWWMLRSHRIPGPSEPRAMGPVMLAAVSAGWLRATSSIRISDDPASPNHSRPQRVYESRIQGWDLLPWPSIDPKQETLW